VPVIDVAKFDLERLVGLRFEEIVKLLEYVKCEIEEDVGERVRLEVTHDRPDHFSAEGLARTLKGVAGVETGLPVVSLTTSSVKLVADYIEERPYISMAVVRDVALDDEAIRQLIQLQEKLHETYGRGRRKIAIGFYDVSKIKPPIRYTRVSRDDEYTPLGFTSPIPIREMYEKTEQGRKYSQLINRENPPALVDAAGQIMVVVPVLGSECCKITEKTRAVLIDVTGTDLQAVSNAMSVLIYALIERGRSKEVEIVEGGNTYVHRYTRIKVSKEDVENLLGMRMRQEEFERYLGKARLGYEAGEAVAPPYRINMLSWVDVAEEVAIVLGYNNLPLETPPIFTAGRRHKTEIFPEELRKTLLAMGFAEVNNYVLTSGVVTTFCKPATVLNPISELYDTVRCSIIPQLIATAALTRRKEVKLFEVGDVVREGRTRRTLTLLISREGATLTDGLSVVKTLCRLHGLTCEIGPTAAEWALPNRSAAVRGDVEGYVAEVNPQILISLGYTVPTVVAELFVD